MASVGLARNSVFAIVPEVTEGTAVAPSSGAQFVPLRPGNAMEFQTETLDNDELKGDIGASKPNRGKESVNGTHEAYLKASAVEGQAPELGTLYSSLLGDVSTASTEYNTVASSTTAVVKVDAGEGATFEIGEALLVKNGSGYEIRNVSSISTDDLSVNFLLNNAPGTGVDLGKAVLYKPGATFTPFTGWLYNGNGFSVEMAAGCQATEASINLPANQYATLSFTYQGAKYSYNPIIITSSTRFIDWTDDDGTHAASVATGVYRTPKALATALQDAMNAASAETLAVTYSDVDGKFTISTGTSSVLSLLWNTGTNAANTIGTKIGFSVAANDTSALTYTSDNAQSYAAPYTPSYDSADPIVCKDIELMFGEQDQNACVCATSATITISKEITDADCICEETGTKEKVATGRTVTLEVDFFIDKFNVQAVDQLLNNTTISAMVNAGPKSGGNWVPGSCVNIYMKNAAITAFSRSGDEFITGTVTLNGFVGSTAAEGKDVYINFI